MKTHIVRFSGVHGRIIAEGRIGPKFVILLGGFPPGDPRTKHHPEVEQILRRGYSVLAIDYPGVRDSGSAFSASSALKAARDAVSFLQKGSSRDLWSGDDLSWRCREIVMAGTSFGGSVALVAGARTDVQHVLAVAPVTNWDLAVHESTSFHKEVLARMYPHTVRLADDWEEFSKADPGKELRKIAAMQVHLVHARDDDVVPLAHSEWLVEKARCDLTVLRDGGHLSMGDVPSRVWTKVLGPAS